MLWRDLDVVVDNIGFLPYLNIMNAEDIGIDLLPSDLPTDEDSFIESAWELMSVFLGLSTNPIKLKESLTIDKYKKANNSKEFWCFINGIQTNRETLLANGQSLNYLLQRPITLYHNPTHGFVEDLAESVFGRTFDRYADITHAIAQQIEHKIKEGLTVYMIGHSQGGIIASNVVAILYAKGVHIKKNQLNVITVAGAQDELPNIKGMHSESFANERDFVARTGAMHFDSKIAGPTFIRPQATGHLLNKHYLLGIARGDYCEKKSLLWEAMDRKLVSKIEKMTLG